MNIVIVGGGIVGTATGRGLWRLGHDIQVIDPKTDCLAAQRGLRVSPNRIEGDPEMVLICVPETAIDEAAVFVHRVLYDKDIPLFIRSSVPPGTCRRLQQKLGRPFGHNPEFLRAAVAEFEFLNPPAVIIGSDGPPNSSVHSFRLDDIYQALRVPIHRTDTVTSELLKLAVNSYLACQVSFWNSIDSIASRLKVNGQAVGMLAAHCDDRVSVYGSRMSGTPYAGPCLPKDLAQLLNVAREQDVAVPLLEAVKTVNDSLGLVDLWR